MTGTINKVNISMRLKFMQPIIEKDIAVIRCTGNYAFQVLVPVDA
jgi:hypothetical protein